MYETFFGLRERPFDLTSSPRFLVLTESHQEALSNLEYAIASRKGLTLLVGEAGSGKTTVIRAAIDRQPARVHAVHLSNPTLSRAEFCEMLAMKFGLSHAAAASKTVLLAELEALLRQRRMAGESTLLVVDEAQSLPDDLLEEIRLLANVETDDEKLLSVVMAGQPELAARLNAVSLRQLKQRVALRCELMPLTPRETANYLVTRALQAGSADGALFAEDAMALIHERSRGIPRLINVLADNALVGGLARGVRPVTAAIVEDVCRDFDLQPAPAVDPPVDVPPVRPVVVPRPALVVAEPPPSAPAEPLAAEPIVEPARAQPARARIGESEDATDSGGRGELFGTFAPKRRRFSLFGN